MLRIALRLASVPSIGFSKAECRRRTYRAFVNTSLLIG